MYLHSRALRHGVAWRRRRPAGNALLVKCNERSAQLAERRSQWRIGDNAAMSLNNAACLRRQQRGTVGAERNAGERPMRSMRGKKRKCRWKWPKRTSMSAPALRARRAHPAAW